jgi:hypothetical protein
MKMCHKPANTLQKERTFRFFEVLQERFNLNVGIKGIPKRRVDEDSAIYVPLRCFAFLNSEVKEARGKDCLFTNSVNTCIGVVLTDSEKNLSVLAHLDEFVFEKGMNEIYSYMEKFGYRTFDRGILIASKRTSRPGVESVSGGLKERCPDVQVSIEEGFRSIAVDWHCNIFTPTNPIRLDPMPSDAVVVEPLSGKFELHRLSLRCENDHI